MVSVDATVALVSDDVGDPEKLQVNKVDSGTLQAYLATQINELER